MKWYAGSVLAGVLAAAQAPQIASYDIDARLDPKTHTVHGHEVLSWLNDSPDLIPELQFHLYMNAFRDEKSTMALENPRVKDLLKERNGWGRIDIRRLQIQGGPDLTKQIRYIQPDDGNTGDRTVMAVTLPSPVKPGASLRVEIDFETHLPHATVRSGWHGDYHFVSQWFPKIGVWEQAGERYSTAGHWNCHQYHANSEFYSDFGRYDVRITVPARFVVGATGEEQSRTERGGLTSYRFVQQDVHDFAWTASPSFLRVERRFDPDREVSAKEVAQIAKLHGIPETEVRLEPVKMILLIQPEHAGQTEVYLRALKTGLKYFGLWYGKYPYSKITLVDPPWGGGATGGMEYPTLITGGTNWLDSPTDQDPEMVTVHEFGHQYWYGMVANNEFEESWLDEGFNTYSTSKILDRVFGPFQPEMRIQHIPMEGLLGLPTVNWDIANRATYVSAPKADIIVRRAWEYDSRLSYGLNSYMRPGVVLRTLENQLGEATMARIMRTYFQRWKFLHPTTRDFIQTANEVSGQDLKTFFDQFVYGSDILDYGVEQVESQQPDEKKKEWKSVVKIRRYGEAILPVDVRIRFADGQVAAKRWDGRYRWVKYEFVRPAEVDSVEIDPGHKILVDAVFANNSWRRQAAVTPLFKWTANLVFWAQNLLLALASLA